jgi:hypothetical protein
MWATHLYILYMKTFGDEKWSNPWFRFELFWGWEMKQPLNPPDFEDVKSSIQHEGQFPTFSNNYLSQFYNYLAIFTSVHFITTLPFLPHSIPYLTPFLIITSVQPNIHLPRLKSQLSSKIGFLVTIGSLEWLESVL